MNARQFASLRGKAVPAAMAATLLFAGCTGSNVKNNSGGGGTTPTGLFRSARIVMHVVRDAPSGYLTQAPAGARAKLEGMGYVFHDNAFEYPQTPMEGRYIKVDGKYIGIGADGEVRIPNTVNVTGPVGIYNDLSDTSPIGTVNLAPALSSGPGVGGTAVLEQHPLKLGSAKTMDGDKTGAHAAVKTGACCSQPHVVADGCPRVDCQTTVNDPAVGCCLDFDVAKGRITAEEGDDGDGSVPGPCTAKRLWEYLGTVCDIWVRRDVCLREAATGLGPFGCYRTHRYRYCQFLDENAFAVSGSATPTVQVGDTLNLTLTNNTPGNETLVTRSGDANGHINTGGYVVSLGADQVEVQHYDEPSTTHFNNRSIVYAAPASLPNNQTEAYDTLTFNFWGSKKTLTVTVRVVQKCGQKSNGKEAPCHS